MVARIPGRPSFWLAETKFHPPLLPRDFILRRELLADLHHRIAAHPLTLLSAPAGSGKTSTLTEFILEYPDLPVTWLSLDEEDNDPVRFLAAFIVALQRLNPDCGATAQSLLTDQSPGNIHVQRVISVLINDALEAISETSAVILDDFHRISEPSIFDGLDYFLEFIPPQLRMVIVTRVDPPLLLARLRARAELSELRMQALHFSEEETAAFLNETLHLDLSTSEVALLQAHTEGWPAGLRLLAGSLEPIGSSEERRLFIQHLARIDNDVFEFLAEEVFNRQEPEAKSFLLDTSILPELRPSLCLAVTRRVDAGTMLQKLYHRNLFLVQNPSTPEEMSLRRSIPRLDQHQHGNVNPRPETIYRYHDLFAEFLRRKLEQDSPERVPGLHSRAARAESDPVRSIGHYLAAAEWHEAAAIIESIARYALQQGYQDTISGWINTLPRPVLDDHPRLSHILGLCALQKGELITAQSMLERALAGYEYEGTDQERYEVMADLASTSLLQADFPKSETLYSQALSESAQPVTRLRVLMELASLGVFQGKWEQAQESFSEALSLVQEPLDPETARTLVYHLVPGLVILPGAIDHLERLSRLASSIIGDEISPIRVHIEAWVAAIHGWRGRWSEALKVNKNILTMNERLGGGPFAGIDAAAGIIAACGATNNFDEAEPYLDLLFRGVKHMEFAEMLIAAFLFVPGRLLWMQNRLGEARGVYEQMRKAKNSHELPMAAVMRAWMRALLEVMDGRLSDAERTLRQPSVLEQTDRLSTVWGSTRIMLARLYLEQNRRKEALAELEVALPYYERMRWPGSITIEGSTIVPLLQLAVEQDIQAHFATQLLGLLGQHKISKPLFVPLTGQTLTRREVEVLELITAGATNRDIAGQLVISLSTVKAHVSHILQKLDVSNRTEATTRARELRLL